MEDKKRIILAEDDKCTRESVTDYLESYEYEVRAAADGQEALQLIEEELPDLLVTDVRMPKMSGLDLISRLIEIGVDFPILVCSSTCNSLSNSLGGLQREYAGRIDLLGKPYQATGLLSRVQRMLGEEESKEITNLFDGCEGVGEDE